MLRRSLGPLALLMIVGIAALGRIALASSEPKDRPLAGRSLASTQAPNARMVALVNPSGPSFVRNKGFVGIKKLFDGQFCLRVPRTIDARRVVAVVSPEWSRSPDFDQTVQWQSNSSDCGRSSRWVEVYTFNDFVFADEAFSVIVP